MQKNSGITPGFSEKYYGSYFTVDLGLDVLFLALADLVRTRRRLVGIAIVVSITVTVSCPPVC